MGVKDPLGKLIESASAEPTTTAAVVTVPITDMSEETVLRVLAAINEMHGTLGTQISGVREVASTTSQQVQNVEREVHEVKTQVAVIHTNHEHMKGKITTMDQKMNTRVDESRTIVEKVTRIQVVLEPIPAQLSAHDDRLDTLEKRLEVQAALAGKGPRYAIGGTSILGIIIVIIQLIRGEPVDPEQLKALQNPPAQQTQPDKPAGGAP